MRRAKAGSRPEKRAGRFLAALFESGKGEGPLRVRVEPTEDGNAYSVESASRLRLEGIHGAGWTGPTVRVGHAEANDFRKLRGEDVREQLLEVLMGLDQTYIRNLGGAEYVDAANGTVVFRWPDTTSQEGGER
ncbi:MAG: hypothetical protein HY901_00035 [Deltaproteobacteria bacterium]|nr:hypothetical protein [Deltaproteobacteria bacterium]